VPERDLIAFCEAVRPRLVGMLGLHCGDADTAEELAQDAIAKTVQNWPQVRKMDSPQAWIYKVALNLANSYFRRKAAERRARSRVQALPGPVVEQADSEWALEVRNAVASLPPRQRTALVLRYYLDLPIAQTALLMGCSTGTVKSLTHKAVLSLRKHAGLTGLVGTFNVG
jgi:RNA polymerase sigma factor (sigma-70 family)